MHCSIARRRVYGKGSARPIVHDPAAIIEAITSGKCFVPKTGKNTVIESIGERIVRLRKEKRITQMELAAALGVTQPVV